MEDKKQFARASSIIRQFMMKEAVVWFAGPSGKNTAGGGRMKTLALCVFAFLVLLLIVMNRYTFVSSGGGAYRLNKLTGEIVFVAGSRLERAAYPEPAKAYIELPPDVLLDHEKK